MTTPIFVERLPNNGYMARALDFPDCAGRGATKEEAIAQVQTALTQRLAQGEIVYLNVATSQPTGNPWIDHAGIFKDDPTWDEFQAAVAAFRREMDEEEEGRD